jgi:alpha-glucosidase
MSTWWHNAAIYQIYPRSFSDSNSDGIGDIQGIIERIPYLSSLGIDAVWMSPFYPSELADGGYDVIDYRDIDPRIGTIEEFKVLVEKLHAVNIKVIIDIVPNHSSNMHLWFQEALNSPIGSPARDRYIFRDGKGKNGELPPNSWPSHFGPTCWTRVPDGQWYLHLFAPEQPDFNWDNSEVREDFERTLRFWSNLDVDGFRIDVAHGLAKDLSEPFIDIENFDHKFYPTDGSHPLFDRDEVHEIYESWREIFNEYNPPKFAVAESAAPVVRRYRYAQPNNLGQAFSFEMIGAKWGAKEFFDIVDKSLKIAEESNSTMTWVYSNHDVVRHVSRFGLPQDTNLDKWLLTDGKTPAADVQLGTSRARAGLLFELALPGSVYLYQGEELGLPEVTDLPGYVLQDPIWLRTGNKQKGRDGCRVPLPWDSKAKNFGFGLGTPHLPMPSWFVDYAADVEEADKNSTLNLYRAALNMRATLLIAAEGKEFEWIKSTDSSLIHFARGKWECVTNFSDKPISFDTSHVALSSQPFSDGQLPGNTAFWLVK